MLRHFCLPSDFSMKSSFKEIKFRIILLRLDKSILREISFNILVLSFLLQGQLKEKTRRSRAEGKI